MNRKDHPLFQAFLDKEIQQQLLELARLDQRSRSGEVRWLIAQEYSRRTGNPPTPGKAPHPEMEPQR